MNEPKYTVGIDLDTTHCALAVVNLEEGPRAKTSVVRIPQLVHRGEIEARELLPSFVYYATSDESDLGLPWAAERRFAVGTFARERARETPGSPKLLGAISIISRRPGGTRSKMAARLRWSNSRS